MNYVNNGVSASGGSVVHNTGSMATGVGTVAHGGNTSQMRDALKDFSAVLTEHADELSGRQYQQANEELVQLGAELNRSDVPSSRLSDRVQRLTAIVAPFSAFTETLQQLHVAISGILH